MVLSESRRRTVPALRLPPDAIAVEQLQRELCGGALFKRGILSSGKAADLAGTSAWEWEELLGTRKVARHYSDKDLDRDTRVCRSQSVMHRHSFISR